MPSTSLNCAPLPPAAVHDLGFDPMSESNATLKEAFRHQAWATRELMAFCAGLTAEQLSQPRSAPLAEDKGSILETFDHIVCTDGGYLGALTGRRPAWAHERGLSSNLAELPAHVDEAEALWMEFLSIPDDAVRAVFLDNGTYETNAAIVTAQALHHGSAHREQICAILRDLGQAAPEIQPWDFADATGRSRWIKPD
jgi:uncharacterized damage-inducible protein DinB